MGRGEAEQVKILILNLYYAPDVAATAQLAADVGEALAAAGHDVTAVCGNRAYDDPQRRYPARETVKGVSVRRLSMTAFGRSNRAGRMIDYATFAAQLKLRLFFGPRADVILVLSTPPLLSLVAVFTAGLRRSRVVFWAMDVYPEIAFRLGVLRRGGLAGRLAGWLARQAVTRSDLVVALDKEMETLLRSEGARRMDVAPNWANDEEIADSEGRAPEIRQGFGWQGRFVVLYSGNLGLAHEFDTAIAAAREFAGDKEVLFAFSGSGPRRADFEAAVKSAGLTNVEFRSYVSRDSLGALLAAGDVHLITLREDMAGLVVPSKLYGILAGGRPVIYVGPAQGGVAEAIARGGCGIRVANGDVKGLVRAIETYRKDRERRREDGHRALTLSRAEFSRRSALEEWVRRVENVGAEACDPHPRPLSTSCGEGWPSGRGEDGDRAP